MIFDRMTYEKINDEQRKIMSYEQAELEERHIDNSVAILLVGFGIIAILGGGAYPVIMWAIGEEVGILWIIGMIIGVLVGLVCCVFGIRKMGKTESCIAETVCAQNNNFYTPEEIYDYYREVREGDEVIIFRADKKQTTEKNTFDVGLFTEHWMQIPRQWHAIAKYSDVVAAWHDAKGHTEFGFMGLYILRSDGALYGMDCHENFSRKIMEEIGNRNPMTILARRFQYEGDTYDVCSNKEQVIQIYKQNMSRAAEAINQS